MAMGIGRFGRMFSVLALVALATMMTAVPVLALDARANDSVTVASGEKVNEDLYLAGRAVTCNGDINGDVFAAGQTVTVGGAIADGLTAAAQTILVTGNVKHGARLAGSTIDVSSSIGRDVLAGGATVTIESTAKVGDDLYIGASRALVDGQVGGGLFAGCEELVIGGTIEGDVKAEVGHLVIQPGAHIEGNLSYTSETEADIPGGTVMGTVQFTQKVRNEVERRPKGLEALGPFLLFAGLTWKILGYLMALVTGIVLILACPRAMAAASDAIRTKTGPVAGWGAIGLFMTPLAAVVVCLTIAGLPLGLITLALWLILVYLAKLPVALVIGNLILGRSRPLQGRGFMIGSLALGLLLLTLVRLIPFIGFFVWLAIALFGIGAFLVVGWHMLKSLRHGDWEDES
jgi:cytoskeletal protein CcmA (bactofilin family)